MAENGIFIDTALFLTISEKAGEAIMEIYNDPQTAAVMEKADKSPLTAADLASHKVIAAGLAAAYPDIPVLSEEGKEIPYETRKNWTYSFCVDPLDGTKEFIKRNGEFTTNIALIHNGVPIAGFIHAPVLGISVWGIKGQGAWIKENGNELRRLDYKATADTQPRFVVSRSHLSPEVTAYLSRWENPQSKSAGSSLKFLLLATGEAQIYPRLAPTMEWDTAAGQAIVEACGGQVIDQATQKPMVYNRENLRNDHFVAVANGVTDF